MCPLNFCNRPSRSGKEPLCEGHYYQRRRGKPFAPLIERVEGTVCTIEGCDKPRGGRSRYCSMHRARIERHGDPDVCIPQADRALPRGEDHWKWTDNPDYYAWHFRLRRTRGPASRQVCTCGAQATGWAYTGPREPGEQMPYRTDETLYVAMCSSCHRTYDLGRINT
jgi:hypothetical protein